MNHFLGEKSDMRQKSSLDITWQALCFCFFTKDSVDEAEYSFELWVLLKNSFVSGIN